MKNSSKKIVERTILILSIVFVLILWSMQKYYSNIVGIFVLLIGIYSVIKSKRNPLALFMNLIILYFDYSVIISKYLIKIKDFTNIYSGLQYSDTMFIGISSIYLFHAIVLLLVKDSFYEPKDDIFCNKKNKITNYSSKYWSFILLMVFLIAYILVDFLFLHFLPIRSSIYEYLLIPFIVILFYASDNKPIKRTLFILIILSVIVNIVKGDRVASLIPLIAYGLVSFYNKLTSKRIILISIFGIILYTIFGLYGDIVVGNKDFSKLNAKSVSEKIIDRKFALDTSYSSYWTGLTIIETSRIIPEKEKIDNFVSYIGAYTILGTKSNYTDLASISGNYYLHYNGGFITSFFYYWFGLAGIVILSVFIAFYLNIFSKINYRSNDFLKILYIYFISSVPRWYLYYPTHLIRGVLILFIFYTMFTIFTGHKNKKITDNGGKYETRT